MNPAHVRPAELQDVPALWRSDAFAQSHPERKLLIERAVRRQECLVAESDGHVAGFAVVHHDFFDHGFISLIVVASEFRRRGIALQLLRSAESTCRTNKLFASSNASNHAAQALLRKAGFSRSGVVENLDPNDPEYIFFKQLRPVMDLREESLADLRGYARIPGVFEAASIAEVSPAPHGLELRERALDSPFRKDYDELEDPLSWPGQLGEADCVVLSAFSADQRLGGIIAAVAKPGLVTWEDARCVAIVWDLRVSPSRRRQGVARTLVHAAETWARGRGCTEVKVETQNTNLAACKFYMQNGYVLSDARQGAYPQLPQDVQLIWRKSLRG